MNDKDLSEMKLTRLEVKELLASSMAHIPRILSEGLRSQSFYAGRVVRAKYILEGHEPKKASLMEWAQWGETADRDVAKTSVSDEVNVSTVFLGLDHSVGDGPPILFETMIFGGKHDQYQERFATWDEAEAGHAVAVNLVKESQ